MSCLHPLTVVNPAKRISLNGGAPYQIQVPCGSCANCRHSKHDEYFFRAFYQGKATFDKGGFIQAVTLTYRPSCLPHLSDFLPIPKGDSLDFPCFSRKDIRVFLVRLRERLYRYGYDCKEKLNFFIASEYGTSSTATHRPHYHCLFYVTFPIDAFEFSRIVGECWPYGITDTYPFKPRVYVLRYTFGLKYTCDSYAMQKKANYVAKYVQKSSTFDRVIKSRVYSLIARDFSLSSSEVRDFVRKDGKDCFRNYYDLVKQFHRQGNGFGADFLSYNSLDEVLESGMLKIQDSKLIVRHIPLPMYYRRRLFYNLVKDFRGLRTWQLNDLGRDWKLHRCLDGVILLARHFGDWFHNLPSYFPEPNRLYSLSDRLTHIEATRSRIIDLLGSRSWFDFARYIAIYKGRVTSSDERFREFLGSPSAEALDVWLFGFANDIEEFNHTFNYATCSDKELFGSRFVCAEWLGDSQTGLVPGHLLLHNKDNSLSLDEFIKHYVICDKSDPSFNGFDSLYSIYVETSSWRSDALTAADDLRSRLEESIVKPNHI